MEGLNSFIFIFFSIPWFSSSEKSKERERKKEVWDCLLLGEHFRIPVSLLLCMNVGNSTILKLPSSGNNSNKEKTEWLVSVSRISSLALWLSFLTVLLCTLFLSPLILSFSFLLSLSLCFSLPSATFLASSFPWIRKLELQYTFIFTTRSLLVEWGRKRSKKEREKAELEER